MQERIEFYGIIDEWPEDMAGVIDVVMGAAIVENKNCCQRYLVTWERRPGNFQLARPPARDSCGKGVGRSL